MGNRLCFTMSLALGMVIVVVVTQLSWWEKTLDLLSQGAMMTTTTTACDESKAPSEEVDDGCIMDRDADCDLTDLSTGVPTVFLSLGRSGSSSTWQIMSSVASGGPFQESSEDAGKSEAQAIVFMEQVEQESKENGEPEFCWLKRVLCKRQRINRVRGRHEPSANIIGTKWKPSVDVFAMSPSVAALEWIAANPHIRVIRNKRNLLDVYISKQKHALVNVAAHCKTGDDECVEKHHKAEASMELPTEDLLEDLEYWAHTEAKADAQLDALGVSRVEISYEKLYYGKDASEWMRIFQFLGVGPAHNLTLAQVHEHMEHAATSSPDRSEKMQNYDEVQALLEGTPYAGLLDY